MAKDMREPIEPAAPTRGSTCIPTMRRTSASGSTTSTRAPGVLRHVAYSGDEIWTVKAGTQRILDVFTLRKLCDIGDEFADGFVHFTCARTSSTW
jgi:sulfite reductase beta subunit